MLLLFFVNPVLPPKRPRHTHLRQCRRTFRMSNINSTGNSAREDEIAAKIANLRKPKLSEFQRPDDLNAPSAQQQQAPGATNFSYSLPDWKKEQLLEEQIAKAEAFFNPSSNSSNSSNTEAASEKYKPKVSTWGVFPRPDNISRTYGGGKNIKQGGVDLQSEKSKQRDQEIAKKLAEYRASRGIDTEREERHREEIEQALIDAAEQTAGLQPYQAIRTLENVRSYVSDCSRLGGNVYLSLGLAYDSVGKRDEAREIYATLRRNPFPDIGTKAKQLLQGFEAMDMLKVDDETRRRGFKVVDFRLPDISAGVEKRYETAIKPSTLQSSPQRLDAGTNLLLLFLILAPIVFVLFVQIPLHH